MDTEEAENDLREYRRKQFLVELKQTKGSDEPMMLLSVTSNGYQWSSLSLYDDELLKVSKAISEHFAKKIKKSRKG